MDWSVFKEMKEARREEAEESRSTAAAQFKKAQQVARKYGLELRQCSTVHYQLTSPKGWLMNIYPGNCRLYGDRNKKVKAPFVKVTDWTLVGVVEAFGRSGK